MSIRSYSAATLAAVVVVGLPIAQAQIANVDEQRFAQIERGRYLTIAGNCGDCHTAPGGAPFAGGLELKTPFGSLLTPNITPDRETGIGAMTEAEFVAVMHDGRGRKGRRLYPAMPYPAYTKVTTEDVLAIRAYLSSLKPVKNSLNVNRLKFPFSVRSNMAFWDLLEFTPGRYKPDLTKSSEWNRGAYLVEGLGHCGTCHSGKSILFGDKNEQFLQGTVIDGWYAPNITGNKHDGIGQWSVDEIAEYLRTGANRWTLASNEMAEVVENSTSRMDMEDLKGIAVYLKSVQSEQNLSWSSLPTTDKRMVAGRAIFKDSCALCHKDSGEGSSGLFPRLAGSGVVQSNDSTTLVRTVLHGAKALSTDAAPTGAAMPAFGWLMDDEQIASVLTYIRNTWGNGAAPVSPETVRKLRKGT